MPRRPKPPTRPVEVDELKFAILEAIVEKFGDRRARLEDGRGRAAGGQHRSEDGGAARQRIGYGPQAGAETLTHLPIEHVGRDIDPGCHCDRLACPIAEALGVVSGEAARKQLESGGLPAQKGGDAAGFGDIGELERDHGPSYRNDGPGAPAPAALFSVTSVSPYSHASAFPIPAYDHKAGHFTPSGANAAVRPLAGSPPTRRGLFQTSKE
jgi:hypothetical protein